MNQITIFDVLYPKYKITKPIRLIELDNLEIIVCDNGDIFTINKNKIRRNGRKDNRKGRKLKPATDKDGYLRITLTNNGKRKSYHVHRLVTRAFLDNYDNKLQVNNINGIKSDNRIENLQIMTQNEHNKLHKEKLPKTKICIECGKIFEPPIKHRGRNKLCSKECWLKHQKKVSPFQNIKVTSYKNNEKIKEYNSIKEASKLLNISETSISNCVNGYSKTAGGFIWKR